MSNHIAPSLDSTINLKEDLCEDFRNKGFIHMKQSLPKAALLDIEKEISEEVRAETAGKPKGNDLYSRAFQQIMNLWTRNEAVKSFVFSKHLASMAAQLLGVRGVRIYHDQALYKEAGGGITPWHCDQVYWPLSNENTITAWIPLQDTPLEMGPLGFSVGSQLKKVGRDLSISQESEDTISKSLKDRPYECLPYELGDLSFHYGYTMHNAAENKSPLPRKVMTVIYMDMDMTVSPPRNAAQEKDLADWMPGCESGDPCDSPLNPVLWSRD